jgi:hypothetical protein
MSSLSDPVLIRHLLKKIVTVAVESEKREELVPELDKDPAAIPGDGCHILQGLYFISDVRKDTHCHADIKFIRCIDTNW